MYQLYLTNYKPDFAAPLQQNNLPVSNVRGWNELFVKFNGTSFNKGVYRLIKIEDQLPISNMILSLYPNYTGRITPFGYDWLGRFFCLDAQRMQDNQPLILFFIPYADQVLEIPATFVDFHNIVLIDQAEPATELTLFRRFLEFNKITQISVGQCADLKAPLYLGGQLLVENLTIMDLTVHWEFMSQIAMQTRDIPIGALVEKVDIKN